MILVLALAVWLAALLSAGIWIMRREHALPWRALWVCLARQALIQDLAAISGIGVATGLYFWRLLAGQVWMPAGGGDLAHFIYPTYSFAAEWWRRGIIPLWNPYLFSGAPFVGDSQSGIFYPVNLLTFLLSSPLQLRDVEFLSVFHFLIAGTTMFLFLRHGKFGLGSSTDAKSHDGGSPILRGAQFVHRIASDATNKPLALAACIAGAVAFEFSDLFVTHFGNPNLIAVAAWMPLVLLFYRRAVIDHRPAFAAFGGMVLAVAFLAGHPQTFLFIVLALLLCALFHVLTTKSKVPLVHHPVTLLAIVAAVAFGLSAPSLLPSLEMTPLTLRTGLSYEQAAQYSLPPVQLVGLAVPGFFGRGPTDAWGPWDRVEVGYLGVLPLLFAILASLFRRDLTTRFFAVVAIVGLGLALGGYAIFHGWLYQFIPGFGQLRVPARFIFLMDFGLAVLAALGMDFLLRSLAPATEDAIRRLIRTVAWASLVVALIAGATALAILVLGQGQDAVLFARIANSANALAMFILLLALSVGLLLARATRFFSLATWAVLALVLIFFDLFSLGAYSDTSADDPTRVYDHPEAIAFMKGDASFYRIDPRGTGVDNTYPADASLVHRLFDISGDNPLVLADYERFWQSLGSRSSSVYDLLNAKYLIGRKNVPLDDKFRLAFDGDPAFDIFENTHVLLRAQILYESQTVSDGSAALTAVSSPDFNPARMVVLEKDVTPRQSADDPGRGNATITGYGPNEIRLETNTAQNGILLLSEVYYPGWRGWVDEREVQVLRADYIFRAIELPAGKHHVRFLYDPTSFKIGETLFGITAFALLGWSFRGIVRARRKS